MKIENIDDLSINQIQSLIDKADSAYYRPGLSEIIPDVTYDALKARLRVLDPDNVRNTRVGVVYNPEELRNKIKHTIPMGSLDNTDDGIYGYDKWYQSCCEKLNVENASIMVSLKIDGGSIRARYENGELKIVATRGDGEVGEDITANGVNFQNLPTTLTEPITCDVRGEAVLYKKDFQKLVEKEHGIPFDQIPPKEMSNPRNIGNGIFGRDNGEDSNLLRFMAFNIIEDGLTFDSEHSKFARLTQLGFKPVPNKLVQNTKQLHDFYDTVAADRESFPFEIDGIVVVLNEAMHQTEFLTDDIKSRLRPKHSRAIKFPHRASITKVIGFNITVGHTGATIPTAILEQVRIGGVNVENVLMNNWEEIANFGIDVGDEIEVALAGDIIPKVIRRVKKNSSNAFFQEPKVCPSCGKPTTRMLRGKSGAVTYCTDPANCPACLLAKIDHWVGGSKKGVGILGIGDTMLKALWEQKVLQDPSDLYTLTVDVLKDVELQGGGRVGKSRAETIIANINSKRNLPVHTFLGSLGIELLGRRRVQILQKAAGGQLDTLEQWLDTETLKGLNIDGFGDVVRQSVIEGIESNRDLIQRFLSKGVVVGSTVVKPTETTDSSETCVGDKQFSGLSFCLTGTRECQDDIERLGGSLKSGVSKGLDFLVQKDPLSVSNKTIKAEQYGVQIISLAYLKQAIAGKVVLKKTEAVS